MRWELRCLRDWPLRSWRRWRILCSNLFVAMLAPTAHLLCVRSRSVLAWTPPRLKMPYANLCRRVVFWRAVSVPAAFTGNGAMRRCCVSSGVNRWPGCAAKWSRWSSILWRVFSHIGRDCFRHAAVDTAISTVFWMRLKICRARRFLPRCLSLPSCPRALPSMRRPDLKR